MQLLSSVATHSDLLSDTQSDLALKVSDIIPDSLSDIILDSVSEMSRNMHLLGGLYMLYTA